MPLRRPVKFQTSLIINMAALVLLMGVGLLVTSVLTTRKAVEDLSANLTKRVLELTDARLHSFFEPVIVALQVASERAATGMFEDFPLESMNGYFTPLIEQLPQLSSLMYAHADGAEFMLMKSGEAWRCRYSRPTEGDEVLQRDWADGEEPPSFERLRVDYDARRGPWFQGAMELHAELGSDAPVRSRIHWTEPYRFFVTKEPGITASLAFETSNGTLAVVGFDVLLSDISTFTRGLVEGEGKVFVSRGNPRDPDGFLVIGLPADPRFEDVDVMARFILCEPSELGGAVADFMVAEHLEALGPVRFQSGGETWWGAMERSEPSTDEEIWIGSLVPERELLDDVPDTVLFVVVATVLAVLLAVLRSLRVARLYGAPLLGLVRRGERMQRLDFRPSERVESHIVEVRRLEATLDGARASLQEYSSQREDTRVARSLREMTLPPDVPHLDGWDFATWHGASDDVDGEVHDVVTRSDGRVVFLAVDLPGAGVATALYGAELRAAFRAVVGTGADVEHVVRALDRFVSDDLTLRGVVPAWVVELEPASGAVTALGLGCDELLHLAADGAARTITGGEQGLGCGAVPAVQRFGLEPGEALVLVSDGVTQALDDGRRRFGLAGVEACLVSAPPDADAGVLLAAVRDGLESYASGPRRDRTVVVLCRGSARRPAPVADVGASA